MSKKKRRFSWQWCQVNYRVCAFGVATILTLVIAFPLSYYGLVVENIILQGLGLGVLLAAMVIAFLFA